MSDASDPAIGDIHGFLGTGSTCGACGFRYWEHKGHIIACPVCRLAAAQARLAEVERERALAIAHDRQPYPTAHAYEQACKALETSRASCEAMQKAVKAWKAHLDIFHDDHGLYPKGWGVEVVKSREVAEKLTLAALALTPADVGKQEEAMRDVVDAAKALCAAEEYECGGSNPDVPDHCDRVHNLSLALAALAAQERG